MPTESWTYGLDFFASGNYIAVNRTLIRVVGLNAAVVVGELADKARMHAMNGRLQDGWFHMRVEDLEAVTGLGERAQRTALDTLVEFGVIEVCYRGLPKTRHVRIHGDVLLDLANGVYQERDEEEQPEEQPEQPTLFEEPEPKPRPKPRQKAKPKPKPKPRRFEPPGPEDVEAYARSIGFELDGGRFCDYYESRGWKYKGNVAMKDWKAAVRNWKRSNQNGSRRSDEDSEWESKHGW